MTVLLLALLITQVSIHSQPSGLAATLLHTQQEDQMWEAICAEFEERMENAECDTGCDPYYELDPA